MKITSLILALGILSVNAFALTATTKAGHFACLQKEWLDDMISFARARDEKSGQSYIKRGMCLVLGDGIKVTVIESSGIFGTTQQFVFQGYKFWTTREGLGSYSR